MSEMPSVVFCTRAISDGSAETIAEALRRQVFTKFWKHGARGGSGLGLYIVGGLTRARQTRLHGLLLQQGAVLRSRRAVLCLSRTRI